MIIYFANSKMMTRPIVESKMALGNARLYPKKNLFFSNKDTFRNFLHVRSFHRNDHRWTISRAWEFSHLFLSQLDVIFLLYFLLQRSLKKKSIHPSFSIIYLYSIHLFEIFIASLWKYFHLSSTQIHIQIINSNKIPKYLHLVEFLEEI